MLDWWKKAILLAACYLSSSVFALDLGQLGVVYEIEEQDLILVIKEKLKEKEISGELVKLHKDLRDKSLLYANQPPGKNIPRAVASKTFALDMTYTLEDDLKDDKGVIIFKKGYSFNPLKIKTLTRTLCFIDGDDAMQVQWVKSNCAGDIGFKKILVDGDISKVSDEVEGRVYFDQGGYLSSYFRIQELPVKIKQVGEYLHVESFEI